MPRNSLLCVLEVIYEDPNTKVAAAQTRIQEAERGEEIGKPL